MLDKPLDGRVEGQPIGGALVLAPRGIASGPYGRTSVSGRMGGAVIPSGTGTPAPARPGRVIAGGTRGTEGPGRPPRISSLLPGLTSGPPTPAPRGGPKLDRSPPGRSGVRDGSAGPCPRASRAARKEASVRRRHPGSTSRRIDSALLLRNWASTRFVLPIGSRGLPLVFLLVMIGSFSRGAHFPHISRWFSLNFRRPATLARRLSVLRARTSSLPGRDSSRGRRRRTSPPSKPPGCKKLDAVFDPKAGDFTLWRRFRPRACRACGISRS